MINQPLINNLLSEENVNPDLIILQFKLDAANQKITKLERQLSKRGMSQEEKNKTFHHDAKTGQRSFTMEQYKALKVEPKVSSEGEFWVELEELLNQEQALKEQPKNKL